MTKEEFEKTIREGIAQGILGSAIIIGIFYVLIKVVHYIIMLILTN